MTKHKIWKTIEIGTDTPNALIKKIEERGMFVSDWAKELAEKVSPTEKEEVNLVKIELSDWFDSYPTTTQITKRMEDEGLELCPAIVALYLRLAYEEDQPKREWLTVWHEPEVVEGDAEGVAVVWRVLRLVVGRLWLDAVCADPFREWFLDHELLVRLRKVSSSSLTPSALALNNSALKTSETSGIYALNERVTALEKDMADYKLWRFGK